MLELARQESVDGVAQAGEHEDRERGDRLVGDDQPDDQRHQ